MNELKVFRQHLLDYNKRTFEKFMQDIEREYRERVNANKKMRYEIEDLKMQVREAEKKLASMKSDSSH
jgi:cell division septum initiation protein DivIVA